VSGILIEKISLEERSEALLNYNKLMCGLGIRDQWVIG
jgi:hypothetical protein